MIRPLRNIAIIAHVDHGKTTLVDALLKQSSIFRENEQVGDLIMDSNDLERERGITILAKNTAVMYQGVRINIIDTPGHADFGGEVERVLNMADACLLLVDAVEGPMPQTRFVLRKAMEMGLKAILVVNKIDRPMARPAEVIGLSQDLFLALATDAEQLDFPIVYTNAKAGTSTTDLAEPGVSMEPLFKTILDVVPAPDVDIEGPLQFLVTTLAYDSYRGKIAVGRIFRGAVHPGDSVVRIDRDGRQIRGRINQVFNFLGLKRQEVDEAFAADIVALSGIDEVNVGDTIAAADAPEALPIILIDEPTVSMTFGVNTSPVGGREGRFCTSRQIRERLYRELETNVSLRVSDTEEADVFTVAGRGELHLSILIEVLRREGYELEVSKPEVITKMVNGRVHEPFEHLVLDTQEVYIGPLSEALSKRGAVMEDLRHDGSGGVRLEYTIPTRGLIGFRNAFLTLTAGNGTMSSLLLGYRAWAGELRSTRNGALVAHEEGVAVTYGLANAQQRGITFIDPGTIVYEGMIVGLHSGEKDLVVNICKEKKQTNVRAASADIKVRLTPPTKLSLEQALDFINDDELVEITPSSYRLRKEILKADERAKARKVAVAVSV
ncbi:MAG: translational GTPase TypA [Dehalococcoidia bacterium]|nr:translational GTPase TypA [Dehalococcoidia bacterium]